MKNKNKVILKAFGILTAKMAAYIKEERKQSERKVLGKIKRWIIENSITADNSGFVWVDYDELMMHISLMENELGDPK